MLKPHLEIITRRLQLPCTHIYMCFSHSKLLAVSSGVQRPVTAGRPWCSSHQRHRGSGENVTFWSSHTDSKGQAKSQKAEIILNQDIHLFNGKERKNMTEFGGNAVSFVGRKESSLDSVCFLVITSSVKLPCMHIQKYTLYKWNEAAFNKNQNGFGLISRWLACY